MKKIFVLIWVLAVICFILVQGLKVQASNISLNHSRAIAQDVGNQDPDSPDFAPGEKADDSLLDSQNPDSPNFAPGEKADDSATKQPDTSSTPSYPSEEDILEMTDNGDSDGTGLLGALFLSPIVSMIVLIIGFFVFIGILILIIVLVRRSHKKNVESDQPVKSEKGEEPKENK